MIGFFILISIVLLLIILFVRSNNIQAKDVKSVPPRIPRDYVIREKPIFKQTFIIAGTGYQGSEIQYAISAMSRAPKTNLARCEVELVPEPSNPYDNFAVRVMIEGAFFGYVPAFMSQEISEGVANKTTYSCQVIEITDLGGVLIGMSQR